LLRDCTAAFGWDAVQLCKHTPAQISALSEPGKKIKKFGSLAEAQAFVKSNDDEVENW